MIHFAPSIYVLQYLDKSTQDNKELRSKALGYMKDGKISSHNTVFSLGSRNSGTAEKLCSHELNFLL